MENSSGTNKKYKDLSKNVVLFTISSFGSKIISFLLVPLYTAVLSTTEYGTVDLITETASLLLPILTVDIQDAVLRFSIENKKEGKVISAGTNIALMGGLLLALALFILKITGILRLDSYLLVFLFVCYLFGALNNIFTLYLKGINKVSVIMVAGILNTAVMCTLNVLLLLVVKLGLKGYLISYAAGTGTAVLYQWFIGKIYKEYRLKTNRKLAKEMISYSHPLVANVLAWWINSASDRYVLTFISGVAANGIYSISYKIPNILSTVQNVFYNAWSISAITEYDKNDTDGFIGNTYTLYSLVCILACSGIMLLNVPLAKALYSKGFFKAWKFVPFLLVGTAFNGIALFQGCIFTATKQTKIISSTTLIGATVNTIGNFIFIYMFGPIGAAFSTMIGYITTWVIRSIKLRDVVQMKVNWFKHFLSLGIIIVQAFIAINGAMYLPQLICLSALFIIQLDNIKKIFVKCLSMIKHK